MAEKDSQLEPFQKQTLQTYILTPVEDSRPQPGIIDMQQIVRALWRWKWAILLLPLAVAASLFSYRSWSADRYVATATLLIQGRPIENELEPQSLSLETYQKLALSDAIIERLRKHLVEAALIRNNMTSERLRQGLAVELVASKEVDRAGQRSYLPMIQLVAGSSTPAASQAIANSWAEVFLSESLVLSQLRKRGALEFVEGSYPGAATALEEFEAQLNETRDDFASRLLDSQGQWQQRITNARAEQSQRETALRTERERAEEAFRQESEELATQHYLETERLKREFLSQWQREIKADERALKRKKLSEFKDRLLDVEVQIATQSENLGQLEAEIKKHPEFIVLAKAISDDALWQKIGNQTRGSDLRELADLKFESQNLNPVYQQLLADLTKVKVGLNTMIPTAETLKQSIVRLESELTTLDREFTARELAFDNLQTERKSDYERLVQQRQLELAILIRENDAQLQELVSSGIDRFTRLEQLRDAEIEGLRLDGEMSIGQLTRKTESAKQTFQLMASKLEAARLARSDELVGVQLGVPAVQPGEPQPKQALIWALAGFVLSLGMVLSFVAVLEIARPYLLLTGSSPSASPGAFTLPVADPPTGSSEVAPKLGHGLIKN